ncbi:MAG TPA: zf-HC2 domain-containing protein [Gaiellales bacterium]|jgi:anti-sigma factor RsiW|nr:zf-HC2 domain-containing protein [Gaiellales bacterium]
MTDIDLRPLPCQELVELVTDYLEGALPPADRERFDRHIAGCDGCTAYLEQMRATIRLTGRLRPDDVDPAARAALLRAFRGWSVSE